MFSWKGREKEGFAVSCYSLAVAAAAAANEPKWNVG